MYKSGELKIHERHEGDCYDNPETCSSETKDVDFGHAYLPHSCNAWEIGGIEEINHLIADLQAARESLISMGWLKLMERK